MEPVDPELFRRTAPKWNCVDYPRDGMHYVNASGGCRWCGMTRDQISAEERETFARWDLERELGIKSALMSPEEAASGSYVCVIPLRWLGKGECLHSPHITIRESGVWVKGDKPDPLSGNYLHSSAHRDCYEQWLAKEGKQS